MADTVGSPPPGSIDSHPDFPEFFRQAREEVLGEFTPRIEQALVSGNTGAFERLSSEMDRQARQRAVVATRAMLNFGTGQGGPMFSRPFSRGASIPTLSGVENQPEAPAPSAPSSLPSARQMLDGFIPAQDGPAPTPGGMMEQPTTPMPPGPSLGSSLQAFGARMVTPFGVPDVAQDVHDVPSLSGAETLPTPVSGLDMGAIAAQDPAAAAIGGMVGFGPAFRAAGVAGRTIASGARATGNLLARAPGTTAVGAGVTALAAGSSEAGAPDPAQRALTTQAGIDRLTAEQGTITAARDKAQADTRAFQERFGRVGPNSSREEIRALQEFLASPEGYSLYSTDQRGRAVRPDGVWASRQGTSGTLLAVQAYLKRLEDQGASGAPRLSEIATELGMLRGRLESFEGDAAMEAANADIPWWHRTLRDYGPIAGAGIGAAVGAGTRLGFRWSADRASRTRAGQTDDLLSQGGADTPQRVGGVNRFFTEGGGQPPFSIAPGAAHGFTPIPGQQSAMGLYPQGSTWMRGADVARTGTFGLSAGFATERRAWARDNLEKAQADFERTRSRADADRVAHARVLLSAAETAMAAGLSAATAYPAAAGFMRYRPTRPAVEKAESEVMRLNALTRPQTPPPPPPPPPPPRPLGELRRDRSYSIPDTTPVPAGGAFYVSEGGQKMLRRGRNNQWYDEEGRRTDARPGRDWRRISSVDNIMFGGFGGTAVG